MTRVQAYLNPPDIAHLDGLAKTIRTKRSQIIRDAVLAVNLRYHQLVGYLKSNNTSKTNPLLSLSGIGKSKTGRFSVNLDTIVTLDQGFAKIGLKTAPKL